MKVVCVRTGKNSYGTVGAAHSVAARARMRGLTLRVYRCEFCGCFHLTTRAYRRRS